MRVLSDGTVASGHSYGQIRIWNLTSGALIREMKTSKFDVDEFIMSIVELKQGRIGYILNNTIEIWDARTGL